MLYKPIAAYPYTIIFDLAKKANNGKFENKNKFNRLDLRKYMEKSREFYFVQNLAK